MSIRHSCAPQVPHHVSSLTVNTVRTVLLIASLVVLLALPIANADDQDEFNQSEDYLSNACKAFNLNDGDTSAQATNWEPPACREPNWRYGDSTPPPSLWVVASFIQFWNEIIVPSFIVPLYTSVVLLYVGMLSLDQFSHGGLLRRLSRLVWGETDLIMSIRRKNELLETSNGVPSQQTLDAVSQDHIDETREGLVYGDEQPIDMSGSYQMKSHENLDAFLAIQGVPWALRRAAAAVLPIHHITHVKDHLRIKIEAKSSGFVTETQYLINGPPVETNVRGRIFSDRVYYNYEDATTENGGEGSRKCNGIVTEKRAITEGYLVTVFRQLVVAGDENNPAATNGTHSGVVQIHMKSTASFPNEPDKADIVCTQLFERID